MRTFKQFVSEGVQKTGEAITMYGSKHKTTAGVLHPELSTYSRDLGNGKKHMFQYEGKASADPHAVVNVHGHGYVKLSDLHAVPHKGKNGEVPDSPPVSKKTDMARFARALNQK